MSIQIPELDQTLNRYPQLSLKRTTGEYRVYRTGDKPGSLWISKQRKGYQLVSTGSAHSIDREVERITGKAGDQRYPDRFHIWWSGLTLQQINDALHYFSRQR